MPVLNFERVNFKIWGGRWINLHVILVIYNFSFTSSNGEFKRLGGAMTPPPPPNPNVAPPLIVLLSSDQDTNKFLVYKGIEL